MNYKTSIYLIFLLGLLFSCSLKKHEVKHISSFHFSENHRQSGKYLAGIEIFDYQKNKNWKDEVQFSKTLYYDKDSFLYEIRINYFNTSGEGEYFELHQSYSQETNRESIALEHNYYDTIINAWVFVIYKQKDGPQQPDQSTVEISYADDSLEYRRVLSLSDQLVDQYRNFALRNGTSSQLTEKIPMPDLRTCTHLITSRYNIITCLSKKEGYYRDNQIDSATVSGKIEVKTKSNDYYYSEKVNESGLTLTKHRSSDNSYYWETHVSSDNFYPVYQREIRINPSSKDTIYQLEMKSTRTGKKRLYQYTIDDRIVTKKLPDDLRIPVTKREIKIWTNKYGKVLRFHAIGFTNQGHQLEFAYEGPINKLKVLTDKCLIPEISGNQRYDLQNDRLVSGDWLFHIPSKKGKKTKNAPQKASPSMPLDFRYGTKLVEKKRKKNYEKFMSPDSLSFYDVYYY